VVHSCLEKRTCKCGDDVEKAIKRLLKVQDTTCMVISGYNLPSIETLCRKIRILHYV
jgi:hypothetical protein